MGAKSADTRTLALFSKAAMVSVSADFTAPPLKTTSVLSVAWAGRGSRRSDEEEQALQYVRGHVALRAYRQEQD